MTKPIFKKLLIFGMVLILFGCSEELYEENFTSNSEHIFKIKKFDELVKEKKFRNLMQSISGNSFVSRTTFENQNGFTISNGNVKIIQTNSLTSYTMLITNDDMDSNSNTFENLVIQENYNGNQKAFVIKYYPTSITPTIHNSFHFEGNIQKNNLAFTGINRGGDYQNTTASDCYIMQLMCNQNWDGSGIGTEHVAGINCKNVTYLYPKKVKVLCAGDSTGGDLGSGGDTGSGTDFSGGGSGGGTGGGAHDDNYTPPSEEDPEVITSPVEPFIDGLDKTPCDRIKSNTNKQQFKDRLALLMKPANFNLNYELGFGEVLENGINVYKALTTSPTHPNTGLQPIPGLKNFTHIHPEIPKTTADGEPYDGSVKIFSPGDLSTFLTTCYYSNSTPEDAYAIMLSNDIHYAMTLTEPLTMEEWGVINNNVNFPKFKTNFKRACDSIVMINDINERNDALQIMFLQEMNKLGIGHKFALFNGTITNPTTNPTISWTRLKLNNNIILHEPCI